MRLILQTYMAQNRSFQAKFLRAAPQYKAGISNFQLTWNRLKTFQMRDRQTPAERSRSFYLNLLRNSETLFLEAAVCGSARKCSLHMNSDSLDAIRMPNTGIIWKKLNLPPEKRFRKMFIA